jgi:NADH-quinone oxidoreductase subunit I
VAWGQDTLNPTAVQESKRVSLPVWTKAEALKAEAAKAEPAKTEASSAGA